jgi:K+-sensing histidine kinase KdpD
MSHRCLPINAFALVGAYNTIVSMDRDHLARVLTSLLENALQNSTIGGEVQIAVIDEPESALIRVLDNGMPLSRDLYRNLFSKTAAIDASPLQLQFCRVAVENCRGEIGGEPRMEGGNCFWIRLPKSAK